MGITVALLAYKEEENLRVLLPQIKKALSVIKEESEILVIDTKEPLDNTEQVCIANGAKYINQEEPFFGGAFRTAIKYATMDKFLILDSDGSHDPSRIPAIYERFMTGADVVIGSRYVEGGKSNDAKSSLVMSKILNTIFRVFLGIRAKDISTDYRMYHTAQLKAVTLTCNNYDVLQEVLLKLRINKPTLKIEEVPIEFNKRMFGESKRSLLLFIVSYIKTLTKLTTLSVVYKADRDALRAEKTAEFFTNLILYGIIGVLAAVIDLGLFSLFNAVTASAFPEGGNVVGATVGFLFSFSLNTFLNFQKTDKLAQRFVSYLAVCLLGTCITTVTISLLKSSMNLTLLKVLCMVFVSIFQFCMNKLITYRR